VRVDATSKKLTARIPRDEQQPDNLGCYPTKCLPCEGAVTKRQEALASCHGAHWDRMPP